MINIFKRPFFFIKSKPFNKNFTGLQASKSTFHGRTDKLIFIEYHIVTKLSNYAEAVMLKIY